MRFMWVICLFAGHRWLRESRDGEAIIVCGRCDAISRVAEARERHRLRQLGRGHGEM
ncbi:hypothetical protein [Terrabacter sp. Root181]|uniref:hypothetical protein n=1 Tax=Terrabacter sp. Root181 TaxID=1736484 RepID=UPI0012FA4AD0|nr:hypothetical protein [Terrabacter sp. Root181]